MGIFLYTATCLATLLPVRRWSSVSSRASAALLLLPLLFTGRALLTGRVYAPVDLAYQSQPLASVSRAVGVIGVRSPIPSDVTAQFIPWNTAVRWALSHYEWPLWNPFELCGSVLAGAAQSAPYHPVILLSVLLPAPDVFAFIASMTYFLAALGAFLFLRAISLTELPALFGAAAWCFSMYVVAFILTAHGAAIALLPLALLAAHRVAENPGLRAAAGFALAMTLLTLCGHPETLMHVAVLAVVYACLKSGRQIGAVIRTIAVAGIATALLTAIFLAPIANAIPQTQEYQNRVAMRPADHHAASWRVVRHLVRNDFVPYAESLPGVEVARHPPAPRHRLAVTDTPYAGALLLAPAAYALWRARRRLTWFFAGLVVLGVLAGAEAPGLSQAFAHLPLFNLSITTRMVSFAAFGLCALAAIGVQQWLIDRGPLDVFCVASAVLFGVLALTTLGSGLSPVFIRVNAARQVVPLLLAFASLRVFKGSTAGAAMLLLLLVQRSAESRTFIPTIDRDAFYPPFAGLEIIRHSTAPFRIVAQGAMLPPATATLYHLEDVRGYQAMTFARLAETFPLWSVPQPVWSNRVDDLSAPFLSLMNVRYAIASEAATPPAGWRPAGKYVGYQLFENTQALPRAFVPAVVHVGAKRETTAREMASCRDFSREAWIETPGPQATMKNGAGQATVIARGSSVALQVNMNAPGWVVISETAWKGWRAWRGAEPLKIRFADHAFVAVYLPRGRNELVLTYRPRAFVNGAVTSAATLLLLIVAGAARHLRLLGLRSRACPGQTANVRKLLLSSLHWCFAAL